MSVTMLLYVRTEEDKETFTNELARILNIEIGLSNFIPGLTIGRGPRFWFSLENDMGTAEEQWGLGPYRYNLDISVFDVPSHQHMEFLEQTAHMIFGKLKDTGKYSLILEINYGRILAQFDLE